MVIFAGFNFEQRRMRAKEMLTYSIEDVDARPHRRTPIAVLRRLAHAGDAEAPFELALRCEEEVGLPLRGRWSEQEEWLRLAAERGNPKAQTNLAVQCWFGLGKEKIDDRTKYERFYYWLEKALAAGDPKAAYNYAVRREDGTLAYYRHLKGSRSRDDETPMDPVARFFVYGDSKGGEQARQYVALLTSRIANGTAIADDFYLLSECYNYGVGVPKNEDQKVIFMREAAERGHACAQSTLAWWHQNGFLVRKDPSRAFRYFLKSARQGNEIGKLRLARCYEKGVGTKPDIRQAIRWYRKCRHFAAYERLGRFYEKGIGVRKNCAKAFHFYRRAFENPYFYKAASAGIADAQYELAKGLESGAGSYVNHKWFIAWRRYWYGRAAAQGHADAQYEYGWSRESPEETVRWWLAAAKGGSSEAQGKLVGCYEVGYGVPRNTRKALYWRKNLRSKPWTYAANARLSERQKTYRRIMRRYGEAAEKGDAEAQFRLATGLYDVGFPGTTERAYHWAEKAAEQGHEEAIRWIQERAKWREENEQEGIAFWRDPT